MNFMGLNFSGNVQTPQKSSIKGSARKAAKKWVSNPESVRVPKRKPSNLFGLLKKKKISDSKSHEHIQRRFLRLFDLKFLKKD